MKFDSNPTAYNKLIIIIVILFLRCNQHIGELGHVYQFKYDIVIIGW